MTRNSFWKLKYDRPNPQQQNNLQNSVRKSTRRKANDSEFLITDQSMWPNGLFNSNFRSSKMRK